MNVNFTLAARYLWGRKLRTFLTTLSIVFGVMLLFGMNGIMPAALASLQRSMLAAAGTTDVALVSKSGGTFEPGIEQKVAAVEGVAAATPLLKQVIAMPPGEYNVTNLTVVGVDPASAESVRPYTVKDGTFLTEADASADKADAGKSGWIPPAALPVTTAQTLGMKVGDTIKVPSAFGSTEMRIVALLDIVATPGSDEIYVTLPAAQAMLGAGNRISEVDAAFKTGVDRTKTEAAVQSAVGDAYSANGVGSGSQLLASLKLGQFIITMFGVFSLAMAGFIILNTFRTMVAERRHDIGMLRAIGASRRAILGMFLTESVLQGIIGTAIGIVAGFWLASAGLSAFGKLYNDLLHLSVAGPIFTTGTWVLAISMGIGVTVLSALVPARAAARITPIEALRPQLGDMYEKVLWRRALSGAIIVALALVGLFFGSTNIVAMSSVVFLVGAALVTPALVKPVTDLFSRAIEGAFRREGGLARANLQRNPGRAAVTASAMMVSVAIVIALLGVLTSVFDGFISYLDKSMGANFLVVPNNMLLSTGTVAADPQLVKDIRAIPGMGDVATLRIGRAALGNAAVQVIGIDPVAYARIASFQFSSGSSQSDLEKLSQPGTIMVNGIFAAQHGLKKGSTLALDTPVGQKSYEVVAVGSDYLNAKLATTYLSQSELESDFGIKTDVLVLANAALGADKAAVFKALNSLVAKYPSFKLYDTQTWRNLQLSTFNQVYGALYFLLVVLALPSLLALVNTLAMGVLARTREIGMLRAIGSTRAQVRRMVIAESLLLAALGTLLGMVAGVWLGYSMVDAMNTAGFPTPYYFPWNGLLVALVIGLGFGVLAAFIPARQATRLDIVQALHYE